MRTAAFLLVLAVVAIGHSTASAHGILTRNGDVLRYITPDPGVGTEVAITSPRPGTVVVSDFFSPGGMDWGPCVPLTERRARCSTRGIARIEVEVYDGDDRVVVTAATPVRVSAGEGDDQVTGGLGSDELFGGGGNDTLGGAGGADTIDGSFGDDRLDARDGVADTVTCGDGADALEHDRRDELASPDVLSCEARTSAEPPPDTSGPRLTIRAPARQRLARDGSLLGRVEASEPARVTLSGTLRAGGRSYRLRPANGRTDAPGQTLVLRARLSRAGAAAVRRAANAGRTLRALLTATATDRTGNRGTARAVHARVSR